MPQKAGTLPTYIALGLAALAAIMSGPQVRFRDIDSTLLWVLTLRAQALDAPQLPGEPIRFGSH